MGVKTKSNRGRLLKDSKPGDVVIQRGTNHNWVVHGNQPCVMAYVLIATEGAKTTGWAEHNATPHK